MRYHEIIEAHHAYGADGEHQPIRNGDTLRVFHGFRDFPHAVETAKHGLSGAARANRAYSYEFDNNPKGLFVTLSLKVASEFAGHHTVSAIVEFIAHTDQLEAPVWPGGSYTVQGQMAQYFGRDAKGRAARKARARQADQEATEYANRDPERNAAVLGSDRIGMADLLLNSREQQALFVGHLNPADITAWHVRPEGARYDAPYERISNEEFLSRYGQTKLDRDSRAAEKLFRPNDAFDGEAFVKMLSDRFNKGDDTFIRNYLRDTWEAIKANPSNMRATVEERLAYFLWPKQIIPAIQWLRATYSG